ncbi:MAG: DUF2325 domain-containing protein [Burkholderiaceae bacterium]
MSQVPIAQAPPQASAAKQNATLGDRQVASHGSRRRRLWELDASAHCPVIGVCLPVSALRRLVNKVLGGTAVAQDYELHCGAVGDAKQRTPIAEAIQRELDRRCMIALRQVAPLKTSEALATWWDQALRTQDVAGPLWAVLSHARCAPSLEHRVLSEVHMLQHQAGMAARVDLQRFEAMLEENAVLARELGAVQQRSTRHATEHARRAETQALQIAQLRVQLHARDADIQRLRTELQTLESAVPSLQARTLLTQQNQQQAEHIHTLERSVLQLRQSAENQTRRADALAAERAEWQQLNQQSIGELPEANAVGANASPAPESRFDAQSVLCVGGRTAAVPLYRHIVEKVGGRFLHHDGGLEDSSSRLEATLAAADLVICQTGCISHNAYWRVKEHCKRTGKRCVFMETPSTAGLKRALAQLQPEDTAVVLPVT